MNFTPSLIRFLKLYIPLHTSFKSSENKLIQNERKILLGYKTKDAPHNEVHPILKHSD